jgi:hypothetical protein
MLIRDPLWAQGTSARKAATSALTKIHQPFMITPKQALDWHVFKAECGPTYAGSTGWKRYTDFLISKMPEFGAVDLDYVEIPYDHYIVEDWPDRQDAHARLAERGREAGHRRNAGAGRRLVRNDIRLDSGGGDHGADAVL